GIVLNACGACLSAVPEMNNAVSAGYSSFPRTRESSSSRTSPFAPCSSQGQALDPRFRGDDDILLIIRNSFQVEHLGILPPIGGGPVKPARGLGGGKRDLVAVASIELGFDRHDQGMGSDDLHDNQRTTIFGEIPQQFRHTGAREDRLQIAADRAQGPVGFDRAAFDPALPQKLAYRRLGGANLA